MSDFLMPTLGADMEAGTLVEWLKHPGEPVHRGDIVAVVDTEKGAIEIEVFEDGVVDAILVPPGQKVPVGTVLARIGPPGAAPAALEPAAAVGAPAAPSASTPAPVDRLRITASPAARRRAAELGVDLATVRPAQAEGPVTLADVERAAAAPPPAPVIEAPATPSPTGPDAEPRARGMRHAIAAAMSRSKREIPHAYVSTSIDMAAALAWLRAENERRQVADRLLPIALLLKAVSAGLTAVPELNGFWRDGRHEVSTPHHVGLAIFLRGGGLVAPAVHDVDRLDLTGVMRAVTDLIARARAGTLRSSELADATITVTNLGERGVEATFGIIQPPQVALVGFGRIADRPWVVGGRVEPRPVLVATLSFDHRAVDGHRAGRFLEAVERRLQQPEQP